jgi:glycosyltransferase involved in cell wall biosynthesis
MIVKNEEKNIERALGWAKTVAFEQIVVDTGSTDRTVELAEKLGAKVYHFEWIKDFAAAKNYAIEQATGDWIAFLDADEYFSPEDTLKLIKKLGDIEKDPKKRRKTSILKTPWIQLNDDGEATSIDEQTRIFRNRDDIRYVGKIHECLSKNDNVMPVDDISIMHTGYAVSEVKEKNKMARNVEMLRAELAGRPNDMTLKAYLADSLVSKTITDDIPDEEEIAEIDVLFREILESNAIIPAILKKKAHMYFISKVPDNTEKDAEHEKLCEKAYSEFPDNIDLCYSYSCSLNKTKKFDKAWEVLKKAEEQGGVISRHGAGVTAAIASNPTAIPGQLLLAAQGRCDIENVLKYAAVMLSHNKTDMGILIPYIKTLLNDGIPMDEVLGLLGQIYDITSPSDLMLIARAAKDGGAIEFARLTMTIAGELMG